MLNELKIKLALIDQLIELGMLDDAVLINEMVIANWSRRADVAVANGKLFAYEIKSDFDTLKRLDGQITAYLSQFDRVTVVTTPKFSQAVIEQMPKEVEVWETSTTNDEIKFKVVRKGKTKLISNKNKLAGFLTKSEIVSALKAQGLPYNPTYSRDMLTTQLNLLRSNFVREYVLRCLKSRYKVTSEIFMSNRLLKTTPDNLNDLSKSKLLAQKFNTFYVQPAQQVSGNFRQIDINAFKAKYGNIPEEMPDMVLTRKIKS